MKTIRAIWAAGHTSRHGWLRLGLILSVLTALLGWSGWTHRLDMAIHDVAQRLWSTPAPDDLVVVAIDEASLQAIGRWPWKRATHAQLLTQIHAAQPKAVLLHVLFSEPDADTRQDQRLADALHASQGKTVLPMGFTQVPGMGISPIGPVPLLATQALVGHAEAVTDIDGVMRQAYLRTGWGTSQWPHLAQLLLDISQHSANPSPDSSTEKNPPLPSASGEPSAWSRQQPISLRFFGPPGTVTTVSYADVLAGSVAPEVFKERIVLIGATAQGLGDRFMTPVSGNGQPMASVEIVAQMVGMLQQDRLAKWVPATWVGAVSALLLFALMALYWPRPPRQGLLLSLAAIVAIPLLAIVIMGWGIWFSPGAFMLMAGISYPLWSWRRLEVASDYLSTQLASAGRQLPNDNSDSTAAQTEGFLERQAHAIATLNEERQATYQLIEQLIQQLPCAVLLADASGQVMRFNEQFKQLLNADASSSLLGGQVGLLLGDWQLSSVTDWGALLHDLDTAPVKSTEAKGPQGQSCLVNVVPMRHLPAPNGTPAAHGVIICLTDTTATKKAETQRDELLSFIAHDMRSPQASLLSLIELHQMNPGAMPIPDLLKHAENLAHGTLALCEELIHVIRSENSPLRLQHHHIGQIVLVACELSAPQAMAKQVTLVTAQLAQTDAWLNVDAGQLQRAITNLLSNAIRFSPEGGEVQVKLQAQPDTWDIEVHDRGEGISSDNLAKLFRRYSRLNTAGNQPNKGFGLGLVFVETVFKRHGGSVLVNSVPGQGSVFTGRLPRHQPK
jgi:CHASE2 domain-containing sensor protein/signal transduction histidine kinase